MSSAEDKIIDYFRLRRCWFIYFSLYCNNSILEFLFLTFTPTEKLVTLLSDDGFSVDTTDASLSNDTLRAAGLATA